VGVSYKILKTSSHVLMKKREKIMKHIIAGAFLLIFLCWIILFLNNQVTGKAVSLEAEEQGKTISLYFYDNKTDCPLEGELYVNKNLLGMIKNGLLTLTKDKYKAEFKENSIITLSGVTSGCFNENKNLPFQKEWYIKNLGNSPSPTLSFETELNPRQPSYIKEMQGFIRPSEVKLYLINNLQKYFKNDTRKDLDRIAEYNIRYREDSLLFKNAEYWQTPNETLNKGHGDCEDWAIAVLSLIKAYNSSLKCYNILWPTHLSIFCYIEGSYIIYDQDRTKTSTSLSNNPNNDFVILQENKIKMRKMLNNYFDKYGLKPKERKIKALFNEKEIITFNDNEEFVDWAIRLNK